MHVTAWCEAMLSSAAVCQDLFNTYSRRRPRVADKINCMRSEINVTPFARQKSITREMKRLTEKATRATRIVREDAPFSRTIGKFQLKLLHNCRSHVIINSCLIRLRLSAIWNIRAPSHAEFCFLSRGVIISNSEFHLNASRGCAKFSSGIIGMLAK